MQTKKGRTQGNGASTEARGSRLRTRARPESLSESLSDVRISRRGRKRQGLGRETMEVPAPRSGDEGEDAEGWVGVAGRDLRRLYVAAKSVRGAGSRMISSAEGHSEAEPQPEDVAATNLPLPLPLP